MTYKKPYLTLFNGITDNTKNLELLLKKLIKTKIPQEDFSELLKVQKNLKNLQINAEEQIIHKI